LETILIPIAALQAALLFSPEDEPAFEVVLATPRPLAWTVLERLGVMLAWQGAAAIGLSFFVVNIADASLTHVVFRWLPPLLFFVGAALCVTFITRRAIFSVAVISLLWFTLTLLGDAMVERWPFVWALHPYLQPDHAEYVLNRWLITLAGLGLIVWAMTLLRDEERLLLGDRRPRKKATDDGRRVTEDEAHPIASGPSSTVRRPSSSVITQLAAMIHYEFLLQWRRRALSVVMLSMAALPVLGALTLGRQALVGVAASGLAPERLQELVMQQMAFAVWGVAYGFLTLLVPVVVAESIPKDRHYGVRELLDSLPLSSGVYLAGKLASMCGVVCAGLGVGAVLIGAAWWLAVGPFDLRWYATVWLAGAVPMAVINPSLALLLAAGQPTNRRALLVGIGFAAVCVLLQVPGWLMLGSGWSVVNPSRPIYFLYFLVTPSVNPGQDPLAAILNRLITAQAATWTAVAGLLQVLAVWALVWAWMRWRGSRG
jgi:hypothetical protein